MQDCIPDYLDDFDVAKVLGVPVEQLDECDSVWVSRARLKLRIKQAIKSGGHFKPKGDNDE